jgi:hypothetical protein
MLASSSNAQCGTSSTVGSKEHALPKGLSGITSNRPARGAGCDGEGVPMYEYEKDQASEERADDTITRHFTTVCVHHRLPGPILGVEIAVGAISHSDR